MQTEISNKYTPIQASFAVMAQINTFILKGYQSNYTLMDAACSLWQRNNTIIDMDDSASRVRLQSRLHSGNFSLNPSKMELMSYLDSLRSTGLDGNVDWRDLSREFKTFWTIPPEELEDGLDYMVSRYVAVLDKLERNYSDEELIFQQAKLEEIYQTGKRKMINSYIQLLQDNLGVSSSNIQVVKNSFSIIIEEKVDAYGGSLNEISKTVSQIGPDSIWLKNHDAYIAAQLRSVRTTGLGKAYYSIQDLILVGQIAQCYQAEIINASYSDWNEAKTAFNLFAADMQAEAMIQSGLMGQNIAILLRDSRVQGHKYVLNALNQARIDRNCTHVSGGAKGTLTAVDSIMFDGIYQAMMETYRRSGINPSDAISLTGRN